ncbi:MAG: phenylalanine--tRNA ligase subunit beta [Tepidiformaceae bacterium]
MRLSLNWLRDYVDADMPPAALKRMLLDATAEVESYEVVGAAWDPERVRVAEVLAVDPHPNADRLRLVTVDAGDGRQQVVCGAPNVAAGQKVAFATEGAAIIDGHTGAPTKLKLRPIRGVDSAGMVLSEKELGLSDEHEGILVLPADARVGRPLAEQLGDIVFDISTWANRADLLGVLGFAREVAVLTGDAMREPARTHAESSVDAVSLVAVAIEDQDLCPRFTASVIQGVTVAPSPAWMQERLARMGMRAINNVVDITNYVMLETGQPLHACDDDRVRGRRIIARRARPGERLLTLDGVDRELDSEMLVICDGEGPLGIAGIMGGGESEVSASTTNVLLEVANFKPGSIRRTSGRFKLRTEASLRFEKGIGPAIAEYAQHRALHLFGELTGGRIARGLVDVFPGKQAPRTITLEAARIEQVLGITVPREEVQRILSGLGFECEPLAFSAYAVVPPDWRPDVQIPDDVIEEIGRIHGYDQLPATRLRGTLPPPEPRPLEALREHLRDLIVAAGFQEVLTYTLTDRARLARVVDPGDAERLDPVGVMNPVAAQHTYLRTSLRAGLLETYAANRPHVEGALRLFEIGFEYLPVEAELPRERPVLCALIGGPRETRWGRPGSERLDFYDAKGALEAVLQSLAVPVRFAASSHFGLLHGHTADVLAGKEPIGVLAQVDPPTAAAFDIGEPVFLLELWLDDVLPTVPERPGYETPSRFPEVRQDLALLLDATVSAGSVLELVRAHRSGGVTIVPSVFDDYRGEGVPPGKKSLALHLRYQAAGRTLTDEDVARVQAGLVRRLEKGLGASLRSTVPRGNLQR